MDVVCPLTYSVHSVFPQCVQRSRESSLVAYHEPPSWWFIQVCGVCDVAYLEEPDPPVFWVCETHWTPVPSGGKFDGDHGALLSYAIRDQRR